MGKSESRIVFGRGHLMGAIETKNYLVFYSLFDYVRYRYQPARRSNLDKGTNKIK